MLPREARVKSWSMEVGERMDILLCLLGGGWVAMMLVNVEWDGVGVGFGRGLPIYID
jgi:hypothetical protein